MTEVIFTMIYGKHCKACGETKTLIKALENRYQGVVRFRYWHIGNPDIDKFWKTNLGIDIETDETMSEEEKDEHRRQGVDKYHALPTFFTSLSSRPQLALDLISGGVFYQSPHHFKMQIQDDLEKMIHKAMMMSSSKMSYYRGYAPNTELDYARTEFMLERYIER